jgi:aspartyl-tRNA(Asn)/glutamyl-tRNA(Gln) amidotransferase subunit C
MRRLGGLVFLKLTLEEVSNVAFLARLALPEEELRRLAGHLNQIIEHFAALQELDTTDVEPTERVLPMVNVYREDVPRPGLDRQEALRAAPRSNGEAFLVPRVVETADGGDGRR